MILWEDEHLLVVNKPPGWNTHAPAPFAGEGVYDWLRHREPRWAKLAIIHRLDKETSGVLAFGKTPVANKSLTEQFTARGAHKKYLLRTDRAVTQKELTATSTLVRAGERYVSRPLHPGGERAETRFRVLRTAPGRTLVEAEPVTGRTHQIRVHAAEHGFPILGDRLYGGTEAGRVFLHATQLTLKHPATGDPMTFTAPCEWGEDCDVRADSAVHAPDALRAAIIEPLFTNGWRLIHGASDGWPGLQVEKLGDFLLAQSAGGLNTPEHEMVEALARTHESHGAYHKTLSRNVRGAGTAATSPQLLLGEAAPERFTILENGLSFEMSFSEGYSVGLFLDQRDNRRRLLGNHVAADFGEWSAGLRPGGLVAEPGRSPALQFLNPHTRWDSSYARPKRWRRCRRASGIWVSNRVR